VTTAGALVAAIATGTLSPRAILLPLGLLWLLMLTLGLVWLTSSLTVRYRDILAAMPFLLQVGLFLAPVGYPMAKLGPVARHLVELNPLTGVIETCRWMTVAEYAAPSARVVGISLVMTAIALVVGWRTFTRLETTMGDEI
jgi:lipopolysaccharide transport system permease protein